MSDIFNTRIGGLETRVGILEKSIGNIELSQQAQHADMGKLFEKQEETKMAVVKGINELQNGLACQGNAVKIENLQKQGNGFDKRVGDVEKAINSEGNRLTFASGWARAFDWGLKILISVLGLWIAYQVYLMKLPLKP